MSLAFTAGFLMAYLIISAIWLSSIAMRYIYPGRMEHNSGRSQTATLELPTSTRGALGSSSVILCSIYNHLSASFCASWRTYSEGNNL